jgi:predicted nucleotidyltransferase
MGKTAAQLTPLERDRYRKIARHLEKNETRALEERREQALAVARQAARILKEDFGVARVLLFGSLATESWFHVRSDVDLAVEGLKQEDFWRADSRLEQISNGFEIDLVDLRTAPPRLAQAIRGHGIAI